MAEWACSGPGCNVVVRGEAGRSFDFRHMCLDEDSRAYPYRIKPKPDRTNPQLRYYFGAVLPDLLRGLRKLSASVGEECPIADADELHAAMRYRFLGQTVMIPGDPNMSLLYRLPRTPKKRADLSDFVDQVILYAAERAIPIRLAHEPLEDE